MDFLNFLAAFQKVAVWPILTPIYYIFQGSSWKMCQPFNFVVLSPPPSPLPCQPGRVRRAGVNSVGRAAAPRDGLVRVGGVQVNTGGLRAHAAARVTHGEISQLGLLMKPPLHPPTPPTPPAGPDACFWHRCVQPKQGFPLSDQRRRLQVFAALPVSAICLLLLKAVQPHFPPSLLAATQPRYLKGRGFFFFWGFCLFLLRFSNTVSMRLLLIGC